ncbi:MAG TPA: hypothetical protein VJS92_10795, partial [Candidatus Polarisedimenticolaceae bacterium]|nr:hypothetical protein [Candidatus Polarisedimenticolaceae bacterium]
RLMPEPRWLGRTGGRLLGMLGLLAGAPLAAAAPALQRPEGIVVGRWVLAPYVQYSLGRDNNLFRQNQNVVPPTRERITSFGVGLDATLPIRNSLFELAYLGSDLGYATSRVGNGVSHDAVATLTLNFGSRDTLILRDRFIRSFSDSQNIDPGGELVFQGQAYDINRWDVEFARTELGRQGYSLRLSRVDFNYDQAADAPAFFDYRGMEGAVEYRQPLPGYRWLTVYHDVRGYNYYRPDAAVGIPERHEDTSSLQLGMRGLLGANQPFYLRLGWGRFRYTGAVRSQFAGLVTSAAWQLRLDRSTRLDLGLERRPLPSSFETYYLINEFRTQLERDWLRDSRYGIRLLLSRNYYGDPTSLPGCQTTDRVDSRVEAAAYLSWRIHSRIALDWSATRYERNSNCQLADYGATVLSVAARLGWF